MAHFSGLSASQSDAMSSCLPRCTAGMGWDEIVQIVMAGKDEKLSQKRSSEF